MPPNVPASPDIWAILSSIGTLTSGLGTLGLLFFAFAGLRQWRAQLIGTSKYEIARKLAHLTVKLQDELTVARNSITMSYEWASRVRPEGETQREAQLQDEYYARRARFKPVAETMQNIQSAGWEAEILLGSDVRERISGLVEVLNDFGWSFEQHFRDEFEVARSPRGGGAYVDHEERRVRRRKVYGGGDNDSVALDMERASRQMLTYLQKYIK